MGTIDIQLAVQLRECLGLRRAVETGTYRGLTARTLAPIFESVITIELSAQIHADAARALRGFQNIAAVRGRSQEILENALEFNVPTLYFLDGHWSGGHTAGEGERCPVLAEITAIGAGNPYDCLVIDDARLFTSAPPPPHDPRDWPTIVEVFDAIRAQRPEHLVTLLTDQVIAVPVAAKAVLDDYGVRTREEGSGLGRRALAVLAGGCQRVRVGRPRAGVVR
jgi:hypothetical protein